MSDVHKELWMYHPDETVLYVATEGERSHKLTNHLSRVRFDTNH